jgi:hypothetical protein
MFISNNYFTDKALEKMKNIKKDSLALAILFA